MKTGTGGSATRLDEVANAAATVFARRGYRRTQIADVARELGVSPGNIYNYVAGKNVLFLLALRRALGERPEIHPIVLPVAELDVAVTAEWVARRLDFVSDYPVLESVFAGAAFHPAEVEAIVGELYDVLARMRLGVEMIERSIDDLPGLKEVFGRVRAELFDRYERYLRLRRAEDRIRIADPAVGAHLLVDLCWWAAGRRPVDPHADWITDLAARRAICDFASSALEPSTTTAERGSR
jgi:AcrR family transcriptional regulator